MAPPAKTKITDKEYKDFSSHRMLNSVIRNILKIVYANGNSSTVLHLIVLEETFAGSAENLLWLSTYLSFAHLAIDSDIFGDLKLQNTHTKETSRRA